MRIFSLFLIFVLLIVFVACGKADDETRVREATHADNLWYPADATRLAKTVDGYLANVKDEKVDGKIVALISPHAGYSFCGQVAGYAYNQIKGMDFDTVVLVGPSHGFGFPGVAVYEAGVFRNPLGDVEVDSVIAEQLTKKDDAIRAYAQPHIMEHSLENQIPFLQRTLSKFKIVPILMCDFSKKNCDTLSSALASVLEGKNALLIASTDMTHYPKYNEAVKADKFTMSAIETLDTDLIRQRLSNYEKRGVEELHCMLCGEGPVYVVIDTAKKLGASSIKILKYANSGDVPRGSKDRVVGYMSAVLYEPKNSGQKASSEALDVLLTKEQQETLIKIARESIETYLKTGRRYNPKIDDERLKVKQGAFVTLREHGMLRGCIGHIIPIEPLCDTVADMAIAAATEDPRFRPVKMDEMKDIHIEISVLSIPRRVNSADEIDMGKHGVIVQRGQMKGVFLPQVAVETGWDKVTFLEHLCHDKAGLPKDAWKDKNTELLVFTAQVFEEEE